MPVLSLMINKVVSPKAFPLWRGQILPPDLTSPAFVMYKSLQDDVKDRSTKSLCEGSSKKDTLPYLAF